MFYIFYLILVLILAETCRTLSSSHSRLSSNDTETANWTISSNDSTLTCRAASQECVLTTRGKAGSSNSENRIPVSNSSARSSMSASRQRRHSWNPWPELLDTRWHISAYVCALRPWSLSTSLFPVALATIFAYKYNAQWHPLLTLIVAVSAISVHAAGLLCALRFTFINRNS